MYKINNLYKTLIGKTTITFFDIELINIKESIKETYDILSDSSWVNKLSNESLKKSYLQRIQYTINELYDVFNTDCSLSTSTGEYLVSVNSKFILVSELKHSNIPLGEIIGKRSIGNGGFDYYSENMIYNHIIFGEAKYKKNSSAYSKALNQIIDFIYREKDIADYADIHEFVSKEASINFNKNKKGYSAGFTFKGISKDFINKLYEKEKYKELFKYDELVLIGVRIKNEE